MKDSPWLSVIVPTYNGEAYLAEALESVARENDAGIELVAVDDGSTDGTMAILERYAQRMPLRVVSRPHEGSWVANTNRGLATAQGEYACILHQDDVWLPGRAATLRRLLQENPEAVQAIHSCWYIDHSGRKLGLWRCPLPRHGDPLTPQAVVPRLLVQNFIAMPSPVFRRETALEAGGMKPHLWYTADWDLWLTLAAAGPTVYYPRPLACFRIHGQSQTIQSSTENDRFRAQLEEVLANHLGGWEKCCGRLPSSAVRAARFSVQVNTVLAARFHGQRSSLTRLAVRGLLLGPRASIRYLRDSRIVERVAARFRVARVW